MCCGASQVTFKGKVMRGVKDGALTRFGTHCRRRENYSPRDFSTALSLESLNCNSFENKFLSGVYS